MTISVNRSSGLPDVPEGDDDASTTSASSEGAASSRASGTTGRMSAIASATSGAPILASRSATRTSPVALAAAPSPAAFADAWMNTFGPAVRTAAGSDGRVTRAEAERIAHRDDPHWAAADEVVRVLTAGGRRTASVATLLRDLRADLEREGGKVAGSNAKISAAEAKRLPSDLHTAFEFLRGHGLPAHRTRAELAAELKTLVTSRFASWPARPLPGPPAVVRGERPIVEHVPNPHDAATRAIVYAAGGRVYASIASTIAGPRPGFPRVGWYDLGAIPPE